MVGMLREVKREVELSLANLTELDYVSSMWDKYQILALRKRHGLTQKELARLTGVSNNYIYLLEKGVKQPSDTLQILLGYIERDLKKELL